MDREHCSAYSKPMTSHALSGRRYCICCSDRRADVMARRTAEGDLRCARSISVWRRQGGALWINRHGDNSCRLLTSPGERERIAPTNNNKKNNNSNNKISFWSTDTPVYLWVSWSLYYCYVFFVYPPTDNGDCITAEFIDANRNCARTR